MNSQKIGRSAFGEAIRAAMRRSEGSLSLKIVWFCVAVFLIIALLDILGLASRAKIFSLLGLSYTGVFQHGLYHQFLTSPFLHGGIAHLLFNMLALWMLGAGVEKRLGRRNYVLFSALCAIGGMAGYLLFNWGTGNIAIGYSAVIFGILVAQAVFFPNNIISIFAFFPLKMKYAVILLGAVELYLATAPEREGIAHAAHIFGALTGFAYLKLYTFYDGKSKSAVKSYRRKVQPRAGPGLGKKRPKLPRKL